MTETVIPVTVIPFVFDELTYSQALTLVISGHLHSKQFETLIGVSPFVCV